jgi:hypothetical protein
MKALLSDIDFKRYSPRVYVFCPGDDMSLQLVAELEESRASQSEVCAASIPGGSFVVAWIISLSEVR